MLISNGTIWSHKDVTVPHLCLQMKCMSLPHAGVVCMLVIPADGQICWWCTGRISLKVINRYVQATGGLGSFGALIALFILQEGARIAATVWLSVWTSSNEASGEPDASLVLTFAGGSRPWCSWHTDIILVVLIANWHASFGPAKFARVLESYIKPLVPRSDFLACNISQGKTFDSYKW